MLRSIIWLGTLVLAASAHGQSLPADVSTRVGRAAEFVYGYTPHQYATQLATRDVVWDNRPTPAQGGAHKLHFPAGVFSGAYTAFVRVPMKAQTYGSARRIAACGTADGECPLAWFRARHPAWIIYKADQVTPAYQYGDTGWLPLDIGNPDVRSWMQENVYQSIVDAGYQAISIDNVTDRNDFGEVGTCSIAPTTHCTADGGTWTTLYSGAVSGDAAFIANRVAWARAITAWAHARSRSTMANVTYDAANKGGTAALVSAFDIWYDEAGFTGDEVPSPCTPKNPSGSVGQAWIDKVAFITRLNGGAGPRAYVSENSICPLGVSHHPSGRSAFEVVEFAVASYLIVKNSHTYLWMFFADKSGAGGVAAFNDDAATGAWPQFHLEHGAPEGPHHETGGVYHRAFGKVLALVNPSVETARTFDLGVAAYRRSDCSRHTGAVALPPMTGMVLLKGQPEGCPP